MTQPLTCHKATELRRSRKEKKKNLAQNNEQKNVGGSTECEGDVVMNFKPSTTMLSSWESAEKRNRRLESENTFSAFIGCSRLRCNYTLYTTKLLFIISKEKVNGKAHKLFAREKTETKKMGRRRSWHLALNRSAKNWRMLRNPQLEIFARKRGDKAQMGIESLPNKRTYVVCSYEANRRVCGGRLNAVAIDVHQHSPQFQTLFRDPHRRSAPISHNSSH